MCAGRCRSLPNAGSEPQTGSSTTDSPVAAPLLSVFREFQSLEEALVYTTLWLLDHRNHRLRLESVAGLERIRFQQALKCLHDCCEQHVANPSDHLARELRSFWRRNGFATMDEVHLLLGPPAVVDLDP